MPVNRNILLFGVAALFVVLAMLTYKVYASGPRLPILGAVAAVISDEGA